MTVREDHGMTCPACGKDDGIDVAATVWTRLVQDGADLTLARDTSQEWTDESAAKCDNCGHVATVAAFKVEAPGDLDAATLAAGLAEAMGGPLATGAEIERTRDRMGGEQ